MGCRPPDILPSFPSFCTAIAGSPLTCPSPAYLSLQIILIDLPGVRRERQVRRLEGEVASLGPLRSGTPPHRLGRPGPPFPPTPGLVSPPHSRTLGRHSPVLLFASTAESFTLKREKRRVPIHSCFQGEPLCPEGCSTVASSLCPPPPDCFGLHIGLGHKHSVSWSVSQSTNIY